MYPRFEPSYFPDAHLIKELEDIRANGAFFASLDNDLEVLFFAMDRAKAMPAIPFRGDMIFLSLCKAKKKLGKLENGCANSNLTIS